jgi:histone H3/H4
MDTRLFYDFRKIFRKIFRSKKISADLKEESNEIVDEKIVPVSEVIQFIST